MIIAKTVVLALFTALASGSICLAAGPNSGPEAGPLVPVDWQAPKQLPPHFRNHCTAENFSGRQYCSDHCGIDYQIFYCSQVSFGCCRLGHGYCDWDGHLRCAP
jgi:hypothetical protein